MDILPASFAHASQIAQLHWASWAATYGDVLTPDYLAHTAPAERQRIWAERLAAPAADQVVLVAEHAGEVAGFSCLYLARHEEWGSYLDNLHVAARWQGQAIGQRLLRAAAQVCEVRYPGLGLYLLVNQTNERAQRFYQANGAHNAQDSVWHAPDGSTVPTFIFRWPRASTLTRS
ncbi:ribosomal protein S18 acetylase RimI-like enzyme [Silvimonas terrae]|uniref:Ribosomal protein S18 acetylase RimI-like enzyme n=1 Tax=Silvimonas terrae TaxID=300266 RepID=A0A840RCJ3_9NEIS|nr:GNAT family N-acetyltransferase [Silvimonas terrae]MBB5190136.1 ribosomal protein S18 acetylase RimI-like enzyme [Silvimonas terrae]